MTIGFRCLIHFIMINYNDKIEYSEYLLERTKIKFQNRFGGHMVQNLNTTFILDEMSRDFIVNIETSILSKKEHIDYQFNYDVPKNIYQRVKLDLLPNWFKNRFPVKYKTLTETRKIKAIALFPDLDIVSEYGRIIIKKEV